MKGEQKKYRETKQKQYSTMTNYSVNEETYKQYIIRRRNTQYINQDHNTVLIENK